MSIEEDIQKIHNIEPELPKPENHYNIGIDSGGDSYGVESLVSTGNIDDNGNMSVTNIINQTAEILDSGGNVISTINYGNYANFNEDLNTLTLPVGVFGPYTMHDNSINDRKIEALTEKVNNLEKLLKESIQKEKKFYKKAKENNRHDNPIDDLEIE